MRTRRAILADIHEFGLDPTKSHTQTSSSGRLKRHVDVVVEAVPVVETTEIVSEVVVEAQPVVEVQVIEAIPVVETSVIEAVPVVEPVVEQVVEPVVEQVSIVEAEHQDVVEEAKSEPEQEIVQQPVVSKKKFGKKSSS